MSPASPALQEGSLPLSHWGSPGHVHTAIFKMNNKDLCRVHGTLLNSYVAAWMGGGFGGERIHVYVWLSPFTVHLKPSQDC